MLVLRIRPRRLQYSDVTSAIDDWGKYMLRLPSYELIRCLRLYDYFILCVAASRVWSNCPRSWFLDHQNGPVPSNRVLSSSESCPDTQISSLVKHHRDLHQITPQQTRAVQYMTSPISLHVHMTWATTASGFQLSDHWSRKASER